MAQKLVIVGRAHSGKNRLAGIISERSGAAILKTSTDRPRRWPGEDTYHFYTKAESAAIPMSEKLLYTDKVDGHGRWADRSAFLSAGIAILDPPGAAQAVRIWQANGHAVKAVYVSTPYEMRRDSWIQDVAENGGKSAGARAKFDRREKTESAMFDAVEKKLVSEHLDKALFGADSAEVFVNRFNPANMDAFAARIAADIVSHGPRAGGYRKFQEREPLVLDPEDWTESEWRAIMKLLGLEPGVTTHAVAKLESVECFIEPGAKNEYRNG